MENFKPDFMGKIPVTTWWAGMPEDTPLQLIATVNIGYLAVEAPIKREEYKGRKLSLAGDELTYNQACQMFKEKVGTDMPNTF
jgi:NmrA-like family